ncbi:hypothetical protein AXG93_1953s1300 [Marchantia polymorpha subsp. ruderalis]|uniref:Germin-like protein n=1 Tax=Marchantia polymorpha subsp. ruderalis TaxID=1480154 RepID=A0A176VQI5_MARPO|nr:hypothetical protein AXG93_1953s1300 [Marchantia polymorpha subsp. ruderalis]
MATMKLIGVLMMTTVVAVWARDPELTTDFAVPIGMNASLIAGDFFTFTGLRNFSAAPNTFGSKKVTQVEFPALTGLGVGVTLLEYKPNTLNPPHTHPRGSELIYVMSGHLDVGLIDSANKLYSAKLQKGDLFVFPQGLVHFQINMSKKQSVHAISAFGSSNAGCVVNVDFANRTDQNVFENASRQCWKTLTASVIVPSTSVKQWEKRTTRFHHFTVFSVSQEVSVHVVLKT